MQPTPCIGCWNDDGNLCRICHHSHSYARRSQQAKVKQINVMISKIITNLAKRFPDMFTRYERQDYQQQGWEYYLEVSKVYKTQRPRFRAVKYGLMLYQRPCARNGDGQVPLAEQWFQALYKVDVADLVKDMSFRLKRIVFKKLCGIALNKTEQKRLERANGKLRKLWLAYYTQLA